MKAEVCKCLDRVEIQIFYIIKDLLRSLCLSVSLFHLFQIILDEFYWQEGAQVFCPTHVDSESVDNEAGLGAGWPTGQVIGQHVLSNFYEIQEDQF